MTILEDFRRDEQRVLDRLVDGELGTDERRALLAALDDEPGAWRRCALTFLEAQSWRWQLSRMAAEPLVVHAKADAARLAPAKNSRLLWGLGFAIAASLLVAFGLGTQFSSTSMLPEVALTVPEVASVKANPSLESPLAAESTEAYADVDDNEPVWETLTLAQSDGSNADDKIQLRVVSGIDDDAESILNSRSEAPLRLLRQLEQAGWTVERQQRLVPVELSDGRRVIVPVEEVDVRYPQVVQF